MQCSEGRRRLPRSLYSGHHGRTYSRQGRWQDRGVNPRGKEDHSFAGIGFGVVQSMAALWLRNIELAAEHSPDQYVQLMGFPDDLPDLARLRPPAGNSRPDGFKTAAPQHNEANCQKLIDPRRCKQEGERGALAPCLHGLHSIRAMGWHGFRSSGSGGSGGQDARGRLLAEIEPVKPPVPNSRVMWIWPTTRSLLGAIREAVAQFRDRSGSPKPAAAGRRIRSANAASLSV